MVFPWYFPSKIGLQRLLTRPFWWLEAVPHACGSVGFHFFSDLVVDRQGRAWLMEIHPTLAVKSPGLGDPEAGWVEVLTRSTRQGTLGTLAISFLGWADRPYREWLAAGHPTGLGLKYG